MLCVGLTGGIACGKTYVRRQLECQHIVTLDLDHVSRAVVRPGSVGQKQVIETFGPSLLLPDGGLDRRSLAELVYSSVAARKRLNAIIHPLVRQEEREQLRQFAAAGARVAVVDAALLIEAGCHLRFDRVIVADCAVETQLERLQRRDGLGREAAVARMGAQLPVAEKRRFASHVIDTNGSKAETDDQVRIVASQLADLAATPAQVALLAAERVLSALTVLLDRRGGGIGALELLQHIEVQGGLDLQRLATQLNPECDGEWWEAAAGSTVAECPESLAIPVALWRLQHKGLDREGTVATAAALARLSHDRAGEIAEACLIADAVCELVAGNQLPRDWRERLHVWSGEARKWGEVGIPVRSARTLDEVAAECGRGGTGVGAADLPPVGAALLHIAGRSVPLVAEPDLVAVWSRLATGAWRDTE
jgi:dephospho-CoA kinase